MKKILLISVIVCTLLTAGVFAISAPAAFRKALKGSGQLVTRTMPAPAFEGIDASRAVKVVVANTDKITIQADDNLIDYVVVELDNDNELNVTIDKKILSTSDINVTVMVPNNGKIRSLEASSASSIIADVALTAPEFTIDASSAAKIVASVKTDKCEISASSAAKIKAAIITTTCEIDASSASKIELAGSAKTCSTELSSASKLSAEEFIVDDLNIEASSAAKASVNCTKIITASVSSGAGITYTGNCSININKSSGGSVHNN